MHASQSGRVTEAFRNLGNRAIYRPRVRKQNGEPLRKRRNYLAIHTLSTEFEQRSTFYDRYPEQKFAKVFARVSSLSGFRHKAYT
mgnify:CR=1 FL=1